MQTDAFVVHINSSLPYRQIPENREVAALSRQLLIAQDMRYSRKAVLKEQGFTWLRLQTREATSSQVGLLGLAGGAGRGCTGWVSSSSLGTHSRGGPQCILWWACKRGAKSSTADPPQPGHQAVTAQRVPPWSSRIALLTKQIETKL